MRIQRWRDLDRIDRSGVLAAAGLVVLALAAWVVDRDGFNVVAVVVGVIVLFYARWAAHRKQMRQQHYPRSGPRRAAERRSTDQCSRSTHHPDQQPGAGHSDGPGDD